MKGESTLVLEAYVNRHLQQLGEIEPLLVQVSPDFQDVLFA